MPKVAFAAANFSCASFRFSVIFFSASPWVDTCADSSVPLFTELYADSFFTRSACALVYSSFNCSNRAARMLVFSSGLMTFNSRSKAISAALDFSIFAFNSSSCLSMNSPNPADAL